MRTNKYFFSVNNEATLTAKSLKKVNENIDYVKDQIENKEDVIFYNDYILTLQETNDKNTIHIERRVGEIEEKFFVNLSFWMSIKIRIAGLKNIMNINNKEKQCKQ